MDKYRKLYNTNNDFKNYVDKYCNCKRHEGVTVEEALQRKLVQNYADCLFKGELDAEQRF